MSDPVVHDEVAMRDEKEAWPKTLEELNAYIKSKLSGKHDYGTCVYAMSLSAVATINFVASKLGVTGFQVSCADLDILRRTRNIKGPFVILKAEDILYPQYNLQGMLQDSIDKWDPWLTEEAKKLLAEKPHDSVHPNVLAHWKKLAAMKHPGAAP